MEDTKSQNITLSPNLVWICENSKVLIYYVSEWNNTQVYLKQLFMLRNYQDGTTTGNITMSYPDYIW